MKRALKIGLGVLTSLIVIIVGVGAAIYHWYYRPYIIRVGPPVTYSPHCLMNDEVCSVWAEFRAAHPYPYQNIGIKQFPDRTAIVVFEPPPTLSKETLDGIVTAVFGNDLPPTRRLRWNIGSDGWVEDLVIEVKNGGKVTGATPADELTDSALRDRVAMMYQALFGTTYGGNVDLLGQPSAPSGDSAPNLSVSSLELSNWVTDRTLRWQAVENWGDATVTSQELMTGDTTGTFVSDDNTLAVITFPTELILDAQRGGRSIESLRVPFRRFAVASDNILGGIWTPNGHTVVVARARTSELSALPPLRFETFTLLAAQSGDELSQSYERTAIFAGKMFSGDYEYKDWAPIYLSEPLIDSEFGALLNITDQMLKSWSEAGKVEYLYFTYPKPEKHPFDEPLSEVLRKQSGSESVLYNWNTAGSAVVVNRGEGNVLSAKQTGSLPVTYGADLKGTRGEIKTGGLLNYEDRAYGYFSSLKDRNLERVVQYTLLYQLFRAIASDRATDVSQRSGDLRTQIRPIPQRAASTKYLAEQTAKLLDDLREGRLKKSASTFTNELQPKLAAFRQEYPSIDDSQLSRILADRLSDDAVSFARTRRERFERDGLELQNEAQALERDGDKYNKAVALARNGLAANKLDLEVKRQELTGRETALKEKEANLLTKASEDPLEGIRFVLAAIASTEVNLDEIRQKYVELNKAEPTGSIKTPSIVISWRGLEAIGSQGGHNLDARALRLEESKSVAGIEFVNTDKGPVLRYNPSMDNQIQAHASELARAVEHEHVEEAGKLESILSKPVAARTRFEGLSMETNSGEAGLPHERWKAQLGVRRYTEKGAFVQDFEESRKRIIVVFSSCRTRTTWHTPWRTTCILHQLFSRSGTPLRSRNS